MTATGDFNGDGRTDIALTGPSSWNSIPVAFYAGSGNYNVTNHFVAQWPDFAEQDDAKLLTGDFNGDGRTDLALLGPENWSSLPVAMSTGNGTFSVTNHQITNVGRWASTANVRLITGDFNADGRTDIALTGATGWNSVPVAFSNGNGTFNVTNAPITWVGTWTAMEATIVLPGDFNGDGRTDFALTGPDTWNSIPVVFSNGDGSFNVANITDSASTQMAAWTELFGVRALTGDFNGDGRSDIALTGPDTWNSVPVAFSTGTGSFSLTNHPIASFGDFAETGARAIVGDYNADGRSDIALTGPETWSSIPVAYSQGNGSFAVPNPPTALFPTVAAREGVVTLE